MLKEVCGKKHACEPATCLIFDHQNVPWLGRDRNSNLENHGKKMRAFVYQSTEKSIKPPKPFLR